MLTVVVVVVVVVVAVVVITLVLVLVVQGKFGAQLRLKLNKTAMLSKHV